MARAFDLAGTINEKGALSSRTLLEPALSFVEGAGTLLPKRGDFSDSLKSALSVASRPPLRSTQGWGTLFIGPTARLKLGPPSVRVSGGVPDLLNS
jgi:hypothetical protein